MLNVFGIRLRFGCHAELVSASVRFSSSHAELVSASVTGSPAVMPNLFRHLKETLKQVQGDGQTGVLVIRVCTAFACHAELVSASVRFSSSHAELVSASKDPETSSG